MEVLSPLFLIRAPSLDAHTSHASLFGLAAADTVGAIRHRVALAELSCFSRRPLRLLLSFWP